MTFRNGILGLTLTSALALGAATANAADVYRSEPIPQSFKDAPVHAAVSNWAGFYIGGNLGGAIDLNDADVSGAAVSAGDDELIGGVHVGYNWQSYGSKLVFGVEGDLNFADNIDYLASLRARLGVGTERALFYATAGVAFIDGLEQDIRFDDGSRATIKRDGDDVGFVVGGGAEFKVSSNWSLGVEGLYYNFDGDKEDLGAFDYDNEADFWTVRGRVTYHINRGHAPLEPFK
jgi:opacity protein-like surface antigen